MTDKHIKFSDLIAELDAITDEETTSVSLIISTPEFIRVRNFGSDDECATAIKAAAKEIGQ